MACHVVSFLGLETCFEKITFLFFRKMAGLVSKNSSRQLWRLVPGINVQKVKGYREMRTVGYSAEQMFDIVNAVEQYPEFVPFCKKAIAHRRTRRVGEYELCIGFPPIKEQYTSRVTTLRPVVIHAVCTEGRLFDVFDTTWRFGPVPIASLPQKEVKMCTILFTLEFRFKNAAYASMSGMVFNMMVNRMVCAFLKRAEQIHGPPTPIPMGVTAHSS